MSVYWNNIFLTFHPQYMYGYSKEPSQWEGSFAHPKHPLKFMGKKIISFLGAKTILILTSAEVGFFLFARQNKSYLICVGL